MKLNWDVPNLDILEEFQKIPKEKIIEHRPETGNHGWHAVTLYGYGSDKTKTHWEYPDIAGSPWVTGAGKFCPKTLKWAFSLPYKKINDIRFFILRAHSQIKPHRDIEDRYWLEAASIAIAWPRGCHFRFSNFGEIPYKTGDAYILNVNYEHGVFNHSDEDRVQLIIHGDKLDSFWDLAVPPNI